MPSKFFFTRGEVWPRAGSADMLVVLARVGGYRS